MAAKGTQNHIDVRYPIFTPLHSLANAASVAASANTLHSETPFSVLFLGPRPTKPLRLRLPFTFRTESFHRTEQGVTSEIRETNHT